MTPLYGLVFAVLATVLSWAGVSVWRAARTWLTARALRRRGDGDTVEIVRRRPLVDLAGHVVLVLMLAVPAAVLAGGGALPGPSGGGGGLPTTGGTMTGQVVFSAVTTDISTGTDESLTLAPNGTGNVLVPNSSVLISGTGTQQVEVDVDSSTANFATHTDDATGSAAYWSWDTAKSLIVSNIGYFGASYGDVDFRDKTLWYSLGKVMELMQYNDIAAGTIAFRFTDNATATEVLLMSIDGAGRVAPLLYGSQSNCSDGAGAAACTAAPAGSVVVDDGATTVVVSTTAVTANSQILLTYDSSLGTKLGVTCNTNIVTPTVSARTAATSFTITISADPATANPACISYFIVN